MLIQCLAQHGAALSALGLLAAPPQVAPPIEPIHRPVPYTTELAPPQQPAPPITAAGHPVQYTFERPGAAYWGTPQAMLEYGENEPFTRNVLECSISDGQYSSDPRRVIPHCRNSRYLFGRGLGNHIYRSTDGVDWASLGAMPCLFMFSLDDDTILRMWRDLTTHVGIQRSVDDGVTWSPALWGGTGEEFRALTPGANILPWGLHQADNGTIVMVEYALPDGPQWIYRSVDQGATWSIVHDVGEGAIRHFHRVSKHETLGRWIAVTCHSSNEQHIILASDDDGLSWFVYMDPNERYTKPTWLIDYNHPTRLLFGSDTMWQVGLLDVSDGPDALDVRSVITNWDHRTSRNLCFHMFEHDGLYYACNYDHTHTLDRNAVISVSADLEHWAVYHRFSQNEMGAFASGGEIGGRLHLNVTSGSSGDWHLALNPARVALHEGLVVLPAATNRFDTFELSSAESLDGWLNHSSAVAGQRGLLEVSSELAMHGESSIHYVRDDGGYMNILSPPIPFEPGEKLSARAWVRGLGGKANVFWSVNGVNWGEWIKMPMWPDEWREVLAQPLVVPPHAQEVRLKFIMDSTGDRSCEVFIDCLQVEAAPGSAWHVGGETRAPVCLTSTLSVQGEWTNVFSIEPGRMSTYLAGWGPLTVRSYHLDELRSLHLRFLPEESVFALTLVGFHPLPQTLTTSPQHFQRHARLRFAVGHGGDTVMLALANGGPVEVATWSGPCAPPHRPLILVEPNEREHLLAHTLFSDKAYGALLSGDGLLAAMDDIGD